MLKAILYFLKNNALKITLIIIGVIFFFAQLNKPYHDEKHKIIYKLGKKDNYEQYLISDDNSEYKIVLKYSDDRIENGYLINNTRGDLVIFFNVAYVIIFIIIIFTFILTIFSDDDDYWKFNMTYRKYVIYSIKNDFFDNKHHYHLNGKLLCTTNHQLTLDRIAYALENEIDSYINNRNIFPDYISKSKKRANSINKILS